MATASSSARAAAGSGSLPVEEAAALAREGYRTRFLGFDLLAANDHQAKHNREHFEAAGVVAINLMGSPGCGKTALLERTIEELGAELGIAVIEGDLETENDAERIRRVRSSSLSHASR